MLQALIDRCVGMQHQANKMKLRGEEIKKVEGGGRG